MTFFFVVVFLIVVFLGVVTLFDVPLLGVVTFDFFVEAFSSDVVTLALAFDSLEFDVVTLTSDVITGLVTSVPTGAVVVPLVSVLVTTVVTGLSDVVWSADSEELDLLTLSTVTEVSAVSHAVKLIAVINSASAVIIFFMSYPP